MNAQQLRNSILQQAIQGKLVPQDPADEPASVLLQRIRKEKERLVKEGKLKKKDLESKPIEEDEIPFEIPENWEWVRFKDVFVFNPRNSCDDDIDAGYIPMTYIESGLQNRFRFDVKKWKDVKSGFTHLADGDIAFAKITPCITNLKSAIMCDLPNGVAGGTTELNVFRVIGETMDRKYILYFHATPYFMNDAVYKGTAGQQRIMSDYVLNKPFPLPPLAEQRRIVAKIEELMPLAGRYGKAQQALDLLNESLPARLRQSILQEAIQGRLVPQDPKEEPASELLKRIRKEKEQLVKEGKLKKKDLESKPIEEDEIPFEIPESWEWVRLNNISKTITKGTTPRGGNVAYSSTGIGFLRAENVGGFDELDLSKLKFVTEEEHQGFLSRSIIEADDVLITIAGTLGRTALVKEKHLPLNANQAVSIVRLVNSKLLSLKYLIYSLNEPSIQKVLTKQKKVTAIPNLTLEIISDCIIPLPPLSEQKRIVAKVEELFGVMR